jgi:hypothetical protein
MNTSNECEPANGDFSELFDQIEHGQYIPIDDGIYDTITAEGWNETTGVDIKGMYDYIVLDINDSDKMGLMEFNSYAVEKFNEFDIELKERYGVKRYIDLVDYEAGAIRIVRNRSFVRR